MSLDTGIIYKKIMTESARHFKQTTTGRKQIPISEVEKPVKKTKKKKEPESLEEALTEN